MIAASASFTAMIALVKLSREWGFQTEELIGWRALVAVPLLALVAGLDWRIQRWGLLLVRCTFGFGAMFCFYSATAGLGIGELSVLSKLQPLFVAVIAPLVLGKSERPGLSVGIALALGMTGTIALVWPVLGEAPVRLQGAVFALFAALFSACAHTTLRALARERPAAIVFWFQIAVGLAALTAIVVGPATASVPGPRHVPALVGIAIAAVLGQLWMTRAYRIDRAARIAAASYVSPLMGFAVDALFFGQVPTMWTAVGAALVIAGGAVLLWGERA